MIPSDNALSQLFNNANFVAILTGAGVSAESGISTFRGAGGIWSKFKPEELANVEAFLSNPIMVWEWYQHRRDILADAHPNAGHMALAEWESIAPRFTLITQNVDGLHRMAGSQNVLELHGNIRINRCHNCGRESEEETVKFSGRVPICPACGGMLRPGVVWFGESLPRRELDEAFRAAETCDVFLSVGTSTVVYPAASLPEIARSAGARVIEVNTEETPFTPLASLHLRGTAGAILPRLVNAYRRGREFHDEGKEVNS